MVNDIIIGSILVALIIVIFNHNIRASKRQKEAFVRFTKAEEKFVEYLKLLEKKLKI